MKGRVASLSKRLHMPHRKPHARPKRLGEFYVCPRCNRTWVTGWDPLGRLDWFTV